MSIVNASLAALNRCANGGAAGILVQEAVALARAGDVDAVALALEPLAQRERLLASLALEWIFPKTAGFLVHQALAALPEKSDRAQFVSEALVEVWATATVVDQPHVVAALCLPMVVA